MKVFISYARPDQDAARRFYKGLKAAGFDPWFDQESLRPGDRWKVQIAKAIRSADFAAILLSSNSIDRDGFYQREIRTCLEVLSEKAASRVWLLPMKLDDCEILPDLSDLHHQNLFPNWDEGFERVVNAIKGQAEMKPTYEPQIKEVEGKLELQQEGQTSEPPFSEVIPLLLKAGYHNVGGSGTHTFWQDGSGTLRVTVPRKASTGIVRHIIEQMRALDSGSP